MAATGMMTVEEFRKLPEGPFYYELRHGEPVQVAYPKCKHILIQNKLQFFFDAAFGSELFYGRGIPVPGAPGTRVPRRRRSRSEPIAIEERGYRGRLYGVAGFGRRGPLSVQHSG